MERLRALLLLLLLSLLVCVNIFGDDNGWRKFRILGKEKGQWISLTWSPDGKSILLFKETKPSLYSLWIMDVGKRKARKIFDERGWENFEKLWSFDSRYIAISECDPKTHFCKLWLLDTKNGESQTLVEKVYSIYPIWSPKELKLVYTVDEVGYFRTSDMKVYLHDIPTGIKKLLYKGGFALSFSPNGEEVVLESFAETRESEKWRLEKANIRTLEISPLLSTSIRSVSWSSNGKMITYDKDYTGIYIMDLESGKEIHIIYGARPVWSPSNKYIAYTSSALSKNILGLEPAMDVCILELATKKTKQITTNGVTIQYFFNPKEDNLLAYISCLISYQEGKLFLYWLKEGKNVCLSSRGLHTFRGDRSLTPAEWSPDGRFIAYIDGGELWMAGPFAK